MFGGDGKEWLTEGMIQWESPVVGRPPRGMSVLGSTAAAIDGFLAVASSMIPRLTSNSTATASPIRFGMFSSPIRPNAPFLSITRRLSCFPPLTVVDSVCPHLINAPPIQPCNVSISHLVINAEKESSGSTHQTAHRNQQSLLIQALPFSTDPLGRTTEWEETQAGKYGVGDAHE